MNTWEMSKVNELMYNTGKSAEECETILSQNNWDVRKSMDSINGLREYTI